MKRRPGTKTLARRCTSRELADEDADALGDSALADDAWESQHFPLLFNVNYVRRHVFGMEAEPELEPFVRHFDMQAFDPQGEMRQAEYSNDAFQRGGRHGNVVAYRNLLPEAKGQRLCTLPEGQIRACWEWNERAWQRDEEAGEFVLAPRIRFVWDGIGVRTAIVWPDEVPHWLRRVDLRLLVTLDEVQQVGQAPTVRYAFWSEVGSLVRGFPRLAGPLASYRLFYEEVPEEVRPIQKELGAQERPQPVSFDQVLDAEAVALAPAT